MLIKDILEFNKKKYFGGAVQANWFYDEDKVSDIATSYVFHGPKYHGVGQKETTNENYKLNDTATYALKLLKKSKEKDSNRFNMTIAGYGTGKSHLSVALGAMLSGHDSYVRNAVINSIGSVDRNIGNEIAEYNGKNLVLVLNGMRDFNLNSEMLSVARKAISQHGLSGEIFAELTKQYQQAISFCKNTFDSRRDEYYMHLNNCNCIGINSKEDIISALENADEKVFNAVNEVYKEFMGIHINVDADISASDVLTLLVNKYCKENKVFDCIYILFDEFGRYIEFTANKPGVAGDSALQQIFEAVQNADGYIVFDAFIQSDLNSYIRRVENSGSNITRYVGRYENSDKYYLSSNFETILANLIEKKNDTQFENTVEYNIDKIYNNYHKNIFYGLTNWAKPEILDRNVWINESLYFDVIAKGCYPMHPVTVWFLANTSSWMQQRSTIAFTSEMFDKISNEEISAKWIPFVYPTDIIGTGLFNEMQNSEEKGYVQSQYCMAYQSIITKLDGKLNETTVTVLRAILIMNILKFKIIDKISCLSCIKVCSGLNEEIIKAALAVLENEHCVISYDENLNRYDLNAEAHGKQEYIIAMMKKLTSLRMYDPVMDMDEELLNELRITTPENTSFATEYNISSSEWQFEKRLINISTVNETFGSSLLSYFDRAVDGEQYRGIIVYVYCGKTSDRDIPILQRVISQFNLDKYPIVFSMLLDSEENWINCLKRRAAIRKFSESEKEMYARFLSMDNRSYSRKISSDFTKMISEKNILTAKGMTKYAGRINQVCFDKFKAIYPSVVPFSITEFEKKPTPAAKKVLLALCRNMFSGVMCNKQAYQGLDPTDKRRIQTALSTTAGNTSWQVFDSNYNLCEPKNSKLKKIYTNVMERISPNNQHTLGSLFGDYKFAPFGMNYYSLFLFIVYVLSLNSKRINIFENTVMLTKESFISNYLTNDKKMLENILKLRITLKTQTDDELLDDLLNEIDEINYVEKCPDLAKELKRLTETADVSEEAKKRVAICFAKLREGIKINNDLYTPLGKAEKSIETCRDKFSLVNVTNVLSGIAKVEVDTPVEELSEFSFSPIYCSRVNATLKEAYEMLDKNFSGFVASLKCAYSELSEFKKRYTNIAKKLIDIGKKDYASTLKNRISIVLQNAELEQKYAATLSEAQRFISSVNSLIGSLDYNSYINMVASIEGWIETFNNADDLNSDTQKQYLNKLSEVKNRVDEKKALLDKNLASVLSELKNPPSDITVLIEHISNAISMNPDESSLLELRKAKHLLDEFCQMKMSSASKSLAEIEFEYKEKWQGTLCDGYASALIASIKDNLNSKRNEWMKKNVSDILENTSSMSVAQCLRWQSIVSELPDYLEEEDLKKITSLTNIITAIIKSQKIQGVVELFSALSSEEKIECLKMLNEKM